MNKVPLFLILQEILSKHWRNQGGIGERAPQNECSLHFVPLPPNRLLVAPLSNKRSFVIKK